MKSISTTLNRRILLADDDRVLSDLLTRYLRSEGLSVAQVFDGAQWLSAAAEQPFDLIIADVMMPRLSGFDALQTFRKTNNTPVIMLTAKGEEVDRIVGLEMGADDYLSKPCNPRELLARIKAILRRADLAGGESAQAEQPIALGALALDPVARQARANGGELSLTSAEFDVLERLMRSPGRLIDKRALSAEALGKKLGPHDRSLDMHISHLRKKLARTPCGLVIKTVRARGFMLCLVAEERAADA